MTSWSWEYQPVMPPYSISEFRVPSFFGSESQCFTWYPDGYESDSLYGQLIPSCHEDLFYESDSAAYWDWKANEYESTDQACQDFTPTCSGRSGNWLGEYISRFVGCWGDNTFSNNGYSGLEMVEDPYRDEQRFDSYCNSDKEMDVPLANEHNPWLAGGFDFQYGFDEDYGTEEHKSPCRHSWEEMELYDKTLFVKKRPRKQNCSDMNRYELKPASLSRHPFFLLFSYFVLKVCIFLIYQNQLW